MEESDNSSFELVLLWLSQNQHLKFDARVRGVIEQLASTDSEMLLYIAAGSLVALQESEHKLDHVEDNYPIEKLKNNIALEFSVKQNEQLIQANKARLEIYASIESQLKAHWKDLKIPKKRATDAAIQLERSDIWINADRQPVRSTLETYIRKWKKELG